MSRHSSTNLVVFGVSITTNWYDDFRVGFSRYLEISHPFGVISIPITLPRSRTLRGFWYHLKYNTTSEFSQPDLEDREGIRKLYKRNRKS
jgi:hypothetical protein